MQRELKRMGVFDEIAHRPMVALGAYASSNRIGPAFRAAACGLAAAVVSDAGAPDVTWSIHESEPSGRSKSRRVRGDRVTDQTLGPAMGRFPAEWDMVQFGSMFAETSMTVKFRAMRGKPDSIVALEASTYPAADDIRALAIRRLDRLRAIAQAEAFCTGFVHVDDTFDPYFRYARCPSYDLTCEHPGYYWAVLLTSGHLERLGGEDALRRDAPVWKVERIERPSPAVVCVLTPSPAQITVDISAAWREYLAPIAPRPGAPLVPGRQVVTDGPRVAISEAAQAALRGEGAPAAGQTASAVRLAARPPRVVNHPTRLGCEMVMGANFDPARDGCDVTDIVGAWADLAAQDCLPGLDGQVRRLLESPRFQTTSTGSNVMDWAFEVGTENPAEALERLHSALRTLEVDGRTDLIGPTIDLRIR